MNDDLVPPAGSEGGIVVYGTEWCLDCSRARHFLEQNNVSYVWIDIDTHARAEAFVRRVNGGRRSVPTILFPDGSALVEPSNRALAEKLELAE